MRWFYVCPECKETNPKYFGFLNGKYYCRKCISLRRSKKASNTISYNRNSFKVNLDYSLTKAQENASNEIFNYVSKNKSCIVNAICGAGKTELVYKSIEYFINKGKKVAFAIPRKDVVKEIYYRLRDDFKSIKVIAVYGNNHDIIDGQIICLTTHQLFRYRNYFSLLILDEADAFPFYKNDLLDSFLNQAVCGPIIYLSATIKDEYLTKCSNVVYVNKRFHGYDLPVPSIIKYNQFNKIHILNNIINSLKNKPILIFVPTIDEGIELSKKINIPFIHSSSKNKEEKIKEFKINKINRLITTSILERGITFLDVQVIVYEANHKLFDKASLIQIAGRVGRKIKAPTGKVFFLANNVSNDMTDCKEEIISKNESER